MLTEEERFKIKKVIPLLRKLGFNEIRDNHGSGEFGKDILFSKYDEFGIKKNYAAQIKVNDINGKNGGMIDDIISHTMRGFSTPFTDVITKKEIYIDEFYIIISGRFTGNAKNIILHNDRISYFSRFTHFIDGIYIEQLFNQNFKDLKRLINATIIEQERNLEKCKIIDSFKRGESTPFILLRKYNLERLISEGEFEEEDEDKLYLLVDFIDLIHTEISFSLDTCRDYDMFCYFIHQIQLLTTQVITFLKEKLEFYSHD